MDEEKAKKRKSVIINRILKWTGLGLLFLLLIVALFFRAPWKVIALLLIILAACTVLPKPYRKWFWLSVSAIVLVLIIWVFLPDDNEGWRPYTFDKELAALNAKYEIPDSQNAATIYNELLENYDPNTMNPDFLDPNIEYLTLRELWSDKDHPELAQWLEGHQGTITKLLEASKIEKCVFPITHDTVSLSDTIDYLPNVRGWAFLLVRAGNNDMAEGRIEEGLQKYLCVGKMGDHLRQQSTLLEMLVGIAVEALALGRFKAFVVTADATESHLSLIEKAVTDMKHDWNSDLPRILECEKLMAKNMLCGKVYQVNSDGRTRLSRRRRELMMRPEFLEAWYPLTYGQITLIHTRILLGWFDMPSTPKKASEIIDGTYEEFCSMAEPEFDWDKEPMELSQSSIEYNFGFLAKLFVNMLTTNSIYRFHDLYLRADAEQKGSRIIIALRRYKNETGHWPQNLDNIKELVPKEVLIDPRNRGSFVYKLTEENFNLYSKGKNEIDEGGKYLPSAGEEPDDWQIWPKPIYKPSPSPLPPPPPPPPPPSPSPQSRPSQKKEKNAYSK